MSASAPSIIYLSQLFDPEPTFKGHDFIRRLESSGFDVEVVTGFPNYPGGAVYDGYRIRPLTRETMGTTPVTRLAVYPSHDRSAVRRIACYFSFMVTAFLYLTLRAKRAELIYVYYPSLTAGLAAVAAKLFRRTPVIIDIQDMWPDSLGSSGMMNNRLILRVAHAACNFLYRRVDHIVVLSPGFKALLVERGVPADKISIVYNWAEESDAAEADALPPGFDSADDFRLLFAGNMGAAQALDAVLDAAALTQAEHPGCIYYFMGGGVERDRLAAAAAQRGLANVRFLPRVPLSDVQRFLSAADALLVHLSDDPLYRITIPSKSQAYLYAGRPILMGVPGDAADLVRAADAGYAFAPESAAALAESVTRLIADGPDRRAQMGKNGRAYYDQHLRRTSAIGAITDLIHRFRRGPHAIDLASGDPS
jgi:colanic acid biosynthesis glycosyl transferase WcaI